jgi:hypothetical protein
MRILTAIFFLSCGTAAVELKNYDTVCGKASDCVPAYIGDVCKTCACSNAAINAQSLAKYNSDVTESKKYCGPVTQVACAECPAATVSCTNGKCSLP